MNDKWGWLVGVMAATGFFCVLALPEIGLVKAGLMFLGGLAFAFVVYLVIGLVFKVFFKRR